MLGVLAAVVQVYVLPTGAWYNWIISLPSRSSAGAVVGAFQGYWVAYRGLPSFIVTLAGLLAWRGGAWLLANGTNISPMDERFQMLGGGLEGAIGPTWSWIFGSSPSSIWTAISSMRGPAANGSGSRHDPSRSMPASSSLFAIGRDRLRHDDE